MGCLLVVPLATLLNSHPWTFFYKICDFLGTSVEILHWWEWLATPVMRSLAILSKVKHFP